MKKKVQIQDSKSTELHDKRFIKLRNIYDEDQTAEYKSSKRRMVKTNPDADNLDHLDQWREQLNSKKKVQVFDLQTEPTSNTIASAPADHFDIESGPQLNQDMVNQIVRSDPRRRTKVKEMESQTMIQTEEVVQVKFQQLRRNGETSANFKTSEQVRIESNKKLLNSLLLDKVQRRVDLAQKNWTSSQVEEGTTQIFSEQAKLMKSNTLNNFKGLAEYFKNSAQFIDYDDVLARAKHYSNKPTTFTQQNNYIVQQSNSHSVKSLMDNYTQLQQYIVDHKTSLYDLRIINNQYIMQQQQIEDDIIQLKRKFYSREERTKQGYGLTSGEQSPTKKATRNNVIETLDRLKLQRENEQQISILHIQQIRMQIQQNVEKQNAFQKELDDLRDKKQRTKMLLKESFMKQLRRSHHTICVEGVVSIVKLLKRINEVPKAVQLPPYLDEVSIQFVFKVASLEQQIEEVRLQAGVQPSPIHLEVLTQQQGSVSEIKQKVKNYLQPQKYYLTTQQTQETNDSPFKVSRVMTGDSILPINKDLNTKLVLLQQTLEGITHSECQRLIKLYMNKKNEADAQELRSIYYALFGQNQGDVYWQQYQNLWCEKYNINPHKLINGVIQHTENQQQQHASLPAIPEKVQQRVNKTMRSLVQQLQVSYDYDLLGVV